MIHINREVREHLGTVVGAAVDTFFPQYYEALSIRDFVENRKAVQPTRSLAPLALFFYEKACVFFTNVNFRQGKNDRHTLYDLTDEIEVAIPRLAFKSVVVYDQGIEKLVVPDGRLFRANIEYHLKTDQAFLYSVEPYGPPDPEHTPKIEERRLLPYSLQPKYA